MLAWFSCGINDQRNFSVYFPILVSMARLTAMLQHPGSNRISAERKGDLQLSGRRYKFLLMEVILNSPIWIASYIWWSEKRRYTARWTIITQTLVERIFTDMGVHLILGSRYTWAVSHHELYGRYVIDEHKEWSNVQAITLGLLGTEGSPELWYNVQTQWDPQWERTAYGDDSVMFDRKSETSIIDELFCWPIALNSYTLLCKYILEPQVSWESISRVAQAHADKGGTTDWVSNWLPR